MPHSVRYKRAAAAEVEVAIGWYARPECDSDFRDVKRFATMIIKTCTGGHHGRLT